MTIAMYSGWNFLKCSVPNAPGLTTFFAITRKLAYLLKTQKIFSRPGLNRAFLPFRRRDLFVPKVIGVEDLVMP
ncbi:hypothetical protein CRP01_36345 [Flavilitoribacter nigricans DSM 23189 = NBRC 102662]|uniref:Uncharacterized protein n=1 Tax=Flavilitoribacter nigricans (strain ATCC 23147 / DSM 23189 / NBRC 102662 / NCIMB 1420 / SS-2) TaxID=1122177 RepID=A0A2D0MZ68_FLAN2|nr:hypothetical protein CRP01_36345 [Flavilitoribacter nigricans DSM 23189 = NBRC 102662]